MGLLDSLKKLLGIDEKEAKPEEAPVIEEADQTSISANEDLAAEDRQETIK
jgi:hypothetical protein